MTHRPYLQITLSTRPLGLEEGTKGRNVTCQYVMVRRRKTKPAKPKQTSNAQSTAQKTGDAGANAAKAQTKAKAQEEKAVKRKAENSQASDTARGGKKRKK